MAFVQTMDDMTSPLKFQVALGEDLPQAGLAVVFAIMYGSHGSLFIFVMAAVSVVKLIILYMCRPMILCLLASEGASWGQRSEADVHCALLLPFPHSVLKQVFSRICGSEVRLEALRCLLADPDAKMTTLLSAVKDIPQLYNSQDIEKEAWEPVVGELKVRLELDSPDAVAMVESALASLGRPSEEIIKWKAQYNREARLSMAEKTAEEQLQLAEERLTDLEKAKKRLEEQNNMLNEQKATLETDKGKLSTEKEKLEKEKQDLIGVRDKLYGIRDKLVAEKEELQKQKNDIGLGLRAAARREDPAEEESERNGKSQSGIDESRVCRVNASSTRWRPSRTCVALILEVVQAW